MARINADALNLEERIVRTNKVQKTTKGGRTMSWSILIVVGDGNGHVGVGIGKARAIPDAIRKGTEEAKKNVILVPMVEGTIPHDILANHGASQVLLRPAAPGTGVVAGGAVRIMLESAGLKDVLAKSLGANNPVNNAWATMTALKGLKRIEDVARLRGKTVQEIRRGAPLMSAGEMAVPSPLPPSLENINGNGNGFAPAAEPAAATTSEFGMGENAPAASILTTEAEDTVNGS